MMKIITPIKRVLDYNIKARVKPDGSGVDLANVKMSINPFDEIAVEEAIRLKEKGATDEIIALSIGPEKAQEQLRQALAMGMDRAILIKTDEILEPLDVAKTLKNIVESEQADLVILGKQAIDDDCNQTAQMLAALLDWPQASFAYKIEQDGAHLNVTREIDGGLQTLALTLPAIISTDLRLNEPRYASLPNIMKAKRKVLDIKTLQDYGIEPEPRLEILKTIAPPKREAGIKVESAAELVEKLKHEAGVLS